MKKIVGYEGAHGNFKKTEAEAIADIIGTCGYGHVCTALSSSYGQCGHDIEALRLREAILAAAAIINKQKRPTP